MRALGVSGGWMFFEHAGSAVAVDLATDDVTDVFSVDDIASEVVWGPAPGNGVERRATLLARSALAASADPLRRFPVPVAVRDNARQAALWQEIYSRKIDLPVTAAVTSLVPPRSVQEAARQALSHELPSHARARAEHLSSGGVVPLRLVRQMNTYFSRHRRGDVGEAAWLTWGGDAGRAWATKVAESAEDGASTLNQKLAEEEVDYDTLRLLPRAFATLGSPHTAACDGNGDCSCGGSRTSSAYPSERALTYLALGGDAGREWASRVLRRYETKALSAAGYAPDTDVVTDETEGEEVEQDGQDGTQPHVYEPVPEQPNVCVYCGQDEMAEQHSDGAVNYWQSEIDPDTVHYFSETLGSPDKCEVCGKATDDTLHKQAALAAYYLHKDHFDQQLAETKQYWAGKEQGVTAGGATFGVDWMEDAPDPELDDMFERSAAVDDDVRTLFWQRRGSEDEDPLTYYVGHTGDDQMMVDQLYVSDGNLFYRFDPMQRSWVPTDLGSPEQIYEVDDATALATLRALAMFPTDEVDIREVDPGEALLMEETVPALAGDDTYDRVAIVTAAVFAEDDGYTPEERAQNAKRQVRDANGRFAKSGSRVAVGPQNRLGVIGKIDPERQAVEVNYDDGNSEWWNAKDVKVTGGPGGQGAVPSLEDIAKIEGKPRATANTPKALLPTLLPQMDAEAINAVIENYPNFIEKERAGAGARQAAQNAQDEASRQRYEAEQQRAEADYRRRLEKVHSRGKSARDWVDRIYNKILPGYKRKPSNPLTAAGQAITDPAQSDVAPIYMAEVDENNKQNVLELLALVPASTEGTDPQVLRYTSTGWVSDPDVLRQLQSSAPPAIVSLDEATFNDTLAQVKQFYTTPEGKAEAEQEAKDAQSVAAAAWGPYGELLAAGIPGVADTPSDISATEKLKRYWTIGEGGAVKIRWNTPGDMTRCMRHLRKYMPRPDMHAGYCAKLHHTMTGTWPGDRRNIGRRGSLTAGLFQTKLLTSDEVITFAALVATATATETGLAVPDKADQVPTTLTGAPFVIPILAPVGVKSGDGRHFAPLSLSTRDLPLPLMWQIQTQEGHDASVIVGRIDSIDEGEDGSLVNARGVFDVGPYGQEAERLVRHKFLRGVSVDLDEFEATAKAAAELGDGDESEESKAGLVHIRADDMTVTNGRVMGATLVAKPAFQQCTIQLEDEPEEQVMVADGTYIGTPGTEAETEEMIRSALTAAGIPIAPPDEWFADPGLRQETPLTVLDDGRVYGHIATWNTEHVGLPFSTRPPRSWSNYAYFHTGLLRTASGADVHVGQITLAGGHAPLEADAAMAVKHYDDTASAFCDVHAGEDAYGIWVAGALRPSVTAEQVRAIRAAAPSGDWRPIHGRLELVAVCQVNVPGFPVTRARVASGQVYALVAAGTSLLNRKRQEVEDDGLAALLSRVEALEEPKRAALASAREAALARVQPARQERTAKLAAAREAALSRFQQTRSPEAVAVKERFASMLSGGEELFRDIGTDKRKEMAKKGQAMPDGSFPISTVGDLKNAIRAYGRTSSEKKAAVRRHIKKRARALGKSDLIPESWASLTTPVQDIAGEISDLMQRMSLIAGGVATPIILSAPDEVLDGIYALSTADRYSEMTPEEQRAGLEALFADFTAHEAEFGRGPGWVTNPKGTKRLHDYWVRGEGAAKIRWGSDGDFDRCRKQVGEEIGEGDPGKLRFINQICAQWHKDATGATPGNAPSESAVEVVAAGGHYPDGTPWNPSNHPRDDKGRFRQVIAELKSDLEGEAGTEQAVEGLDEVQQAADSGDVDAAQTAAKNVLDMVDKIASSTQDTETVKTLREGYGNLAEAVANLPLAFGDLNQKYRFSDLPPELKGLVEDLVKRGQSLLEPKDMAEAGGKLQEFMAGGDVLSQPQLSAELSRLLRFLI